MRMIVVLARPVSCSMRYRDTPGAAAARTRLSRSRVTNADSISVCSALSQGDLTQIAVSVKERFAAVARDVDALENVLVTSWKPALPERELAGGQFFAAGVAALGVLLNDPAADMEAARPDLSAWWARNLDKFRGWGALEDRSGVQVGQLAAVSSGSITWKAPAGSE